MHPMGRYRNINNEAIGVLEKTERGDGEIQTFLGEFTYLQTSYIMVYTDSKGLQHVMPHSEESVKAVLRKVDDQSESQV